MDTETLTKCARAECDNPAVEGDFCSVMCRHRFEEDSAWITTNRFSSITCIIPGCDVLVGPLDGVGCRDHKEHAVTYVEQKLAEARTEWEIRHATAQ